MTDPDDATAPDSVDPDIVNQAWRHLVPPQVRADLLRRQAAELLRQADEIEQEPDR